MERESFLFYVSWLEGIKRLPIKTQKEIKVALLDYCAYGIEPNFDKVSPEVYLAFIYAKPQIDANNRRYINGRKGGSRQGLSNNPNGRRGKKELPVVVNQKTTKELPMVDKNNYQRTTEKLPNDNVNDNVNVNENDNVNDIINNINSCAGNFQEKLSDTHQIILENEKPKRVYFKKPTLEEIKAYIQEKNYSYTDAEKFYDFYESKNWMVGKNKMSKWKSAIANWERTQKERQRPNSRVGVIIQPDKVDYENMESGW